MIGMGCGTVTAPSTVAMENGEIEKYNDSESLAVIVSGSLSLGEVVGSAIGSVDHQWFEPTSHALSVIFAILVAAMALVK